MSLSGPHPPWLSHFICLYVVNSENCILIPDFSPKLYFHISNCLLTNNIFTWMSIIFLKFVCISTHVPNWALHLPVSPAASLPQLMAIPSFHLWQAKNLKISWVLFILCSVCPEFLFVHNCPQSDHFCSLLLPPVRFRPLFSHWSHYQKFPNSVPNLALALNTSFYSPEWSFQNIEQIMFL